MTSEETNIRVFIADDHPLMRNALEAAVDSAPDMEVIGQAVNGVDALALIPKVKPDVIIMDLVMPEMDGWQAIEALQEQDTQYPVLALSSVSAEDKILRAVKLGARGFLSKNVHWDELIGAVRAVASGEAYLPPKITGKLMQSMHQNEKQKIPFDSLTKRQKDVMRCLGQGLSNQEIADELHISTATLRVHIHHMMNTLGFENHRELIVYAARLLLDG